MKIALKLAGRAAEGILARSRRGWLKRAGRDGGRVTDGPTGFRVPPEN